MPATIYEFFATQLTWGVFFGEVLWAIVLNAAVWSALLSVGVRAMAWLFNIPLLEKRRELAFWIIVPLFLFIVVMFVSSHLQAINPSVGKPTLDGVIHASGVEPSSHYPNAINITLIVGVVNTGTPSIVDYWTLNVIIPGEQNPITTKHTMLPPLVSFVQPDGQSITYSNRDALYDKTIQRPLTTGMIARGLLNFRVDNMRIETIHRPGTKFVLRYRDVTGKEYTTEVTWGAIETNVFHFPGLTPVPSVST